MGFHDANALISRDPGAHRYIKYPSSQRCLSDSRNRHLTIQILQEIGSLCRIKSCQPQKFQS